ncbi:MAG: ferredoxin reductase family protein [Pseudoruegeria sp.]
MRPIGLLIILASCLVPIFGFAQLAQIHPSSPLLGQYLGIVSLIMMALGQFLATRLRLVEWIFGPMDKTYVLHKWLGIVAVITMLLHDNIGAKIKGLGPKGAWDDFGEGLGEQGMNGILILVGLSVALFIPYHWWRLTHRIIGVFFILSVLHFVMIDKPFATTDPLGLYTLAICAIGVASYAYTQVPLRLKPKSMYTVTDVVTTGGATEITLKPGAKSMRHRAGQFAFFSFQTPDLKEVHPFTISCAPNNDGMLSITVKDLGAYTHALKTKVKNGTSVAVQGPFGRFSPPRGKAPQIWIAAGIGITPYIAMLETRGPEDAPIEMFYTFRGRQNAPHLEALQINAAQRANVTLHLVDTSTADRLTAAHIAQQSNYDVSQSKVLYCGPTALRKALSQDLQKLGVAKRRFHYEEFEIRSAFWPLERINEPAQKFVKKLDFRAFRSN